MLFNCLPKEIRNLTNVGVQEVLNCFSSSLPDEPKIGGAITLNSEKSNSVIHQVSRGEWGGVDPPGDESSL